MNQNSRRKTVEKLLEIIKHECIKRKVGNCVRQNIRECRNRFVSWIIGYCTMKEGVHTAYCTCTVYRGFAVCATREFLYKQWTKLRGVPVSQWSYQYILQHNFKMGFIIRLTYTDWTEKVSLVTTPILKYNGWWIRKRIKGFDRAINVIHSISGENQFQFEFNDWSHIAKQQCNTSHCMAHLLHITIMTLALCVSGTRVTTEWAYGILLKYCSITICYILQDHMPLVRTNLCHGYESHRNHQIEQVLPQTAHKINQSRAYQSKTINIIKNAWRYTKSNACRTLFWLC